MLEALKAHGLVCLGYFAVDEGEAEFPGINGRPCRFVALIGNAGPAMFRAFSAVSDPATELMDDWCRRVIDPIAAEAGALALYPFDKPPLPFLTWARRAGQSHISPLGLNIHSEYGLWHAYRAALVFAESPDFAFDWPTRAMESFHPCKTCTEKPCLSACPVSAFTESGYDVPACARHLKSVSGDDCMSKGCLARRACPVGRDYTYAPEQAHFHMLAFRKAH